MSKKKNLWLTPIPSNVPTQKVALSFKIAAADIGKPPNEVIKIDDDMMISFISMNSYTNGLIMGDKIVKVNDISGKAAKCQAELVKGESCQVEVLRRKGAFPVTKERLNKSLPVVKKGYAVFTVEVERPSNMTTTAVGMKLTIMKKRGFVVKSDPNTITATFIGRGDSIIDMDGLVVPPLDGSAEGYVRENLAKLSTGRKVSFLVERPIQLSYAKEMQKYIESIACDDADVEMAKDVIEIGREASNMHFIVLKKLTTPSILSSDVRKRKTNDKTSESAESNISISTASTVMKITSDVPDEDELKPVVTKSHAVSSKHNDDDGGMFDSE